MADRNIAREVQMGAANRLHMRFNVALGNVMDVARPACDGPDCSVCGAVIGLLPGLGLAEVLSGPSGQSPSGAVSAIADRAPEVLAAINALDDEGFQFIIVQVWQLSQNAGGFKDKVGFAALRAACEAWVNRLAGGQ